MDKLSDRVLKPFTLDGDQQKILDDWKREHPREVEFMQKYQLEPRSEEQLAAEMYERAMHAKVELLESEGRPPSFWDRAELPQSSAGKAYEQQQEALRVAAKGGAGERTDVPRAVSQKPFKV